MKEVGDVIGGTRNSDAGAAAGVVAPSVGWESPHLPSPEDGARMVASAQDLLAAVRRGAVEPAVADSLVSALVGMVGSLESWINALSAQRSALVALTAAVTEEMPGVMVPVAPDDAAGPGSQVAEYARRALVAELATAMSGSEATTATLVDTSVELAEHLPGVLCAMGAGVIGDKHARQIVRHGQDLPPAAKPGFEADVLSRLTSHRTPAGLGRVARETRDRIHPVPAAERHDRASQQRAVFLDPAPDGMAWLSAFLPAVQAAAIYDKVSDIGRSLGDDPDERRTLAQRRADVLSALTLDTFAWDASAPGTAGVGRSEMCPADVDPTGAHPSNTRPTGAHPSDTHPSNTRQTGTHPSDTRPSDTCPTGTHPSDTHPSNTRQTGAHPSSADPPGSAAPPTTPLVATPPDDRRAGPDEGPPSGEPPPEGPQPADPPPDGVIDTGLLALRPVVAVTVPVMTLLGRAELPGHLDGYGPIDPETARVLAARAPSFIRILTHPETGAVLSVGRDRYAVPADLRTWLRLRDQTCRFPGCHRVAIGCEVDHTVAFREHGARGTTSADNLAHLCRKHHRLKHTSRWRVTQHADANLTWVSPTGRSYASAPGMTPPGPGAVPNAHPGADLGAELSGHADSAPGANPSGHPSTDPGNHPDAVPSTNPSGPPSTDPSNHPDAVPSANPSTLPGAVPDANSGPGATRLRTEP